jgi:hypothetical protein
MVCFAAALGPTLTSEARDEAVTVDVGGIVRFSLTHMRPIAGSRVLTPGVEAAMPPPPRSRTRESQQLRDATAAVAM